MEDVLTIEYAVQYGTAVVWAHEHLAATALKSARTFAENAARETGHEIIELGNGFRVGAETWTVKGRE